MGSIRRHLLYCGFELLKKIGYINRISISADCATILMFHRVNDHSDKHLTTSQIVFEETICAISNNYKTVSLPSLIQIINGKEKLDPKTIVVTFDDGYRDNFLNAAPILLKYGVPATFFITTGYIGSQKVFDWDQDSDVSYPLMSWQEVRDLAGMGFDIGSHTVNHVNLGKTSIALARQELRDSKNQIESEIGKPVTSFSYPFGRKDCIRPDVMDIVREVGYNCCCSGYGGKVNNGSDVYNLHRVGMYPNVLELEMELEGFMTYYDNEMSINLFRKNQIPAITKGVIL
jgi:peptidoglycan/xylan/chitin deacetylase (PgdA/CDA1 family)